jgi:hypothetical protein
MSLSRKQLQEAAERLYISVEAFDYTEPNVNKLQAAALLQIAANTLNDKNVDGLQR